MQRSEKEEIFPSAPLAWQSELDSHLVAVEGLLPHPLFARCALCYLNGKSREARWTDEGAGAFPSYLARQAEDDFRAIWCFPCRGVPAEGDTNRQVISRKSCLSSHECRLLPFRLFVPLDLEQNIV